jgi:ABC-type sugar transport system permease subunit
MFNYFVQGNYNLAAAVATLLTLLTLVATVFLFRRMVRP